MKHQAARTFRIEGIYVAVFFSFSSLLNFPTVIEAKESANVTTLLSSTIVVDETNSAQFTIDILFQNRSENPAVLSSYDLAVGDVLPTDIKATAEATVLETILREVQGSIIEVSMGNTILGSGLTSAIQISYKVDHFMFRNAGTYDAVLPLFRETSTAAGESILFIYPESFGEVNYATAAFEVTTTGGKTRLLFDDLENISRLYLSVGESKYINVAMERSFVNETDAYVKQEVLIPPEYSSQLFAITSISPIPESARASDDGNYLLTYSIPANETLWVRIQGVLLNKKPEESAYTLNPQERELALETESVWWHISDENVILDIADIAELETLDEKIERIYEYTKKELILSSGFRQLHGSEFRKGASTALKTYKNASVEDYADVFVALCRYTGIPARVVAGYVFPYSIEESQLGMFHVWPQYWSDDLGWVSVDPAFEMYAELPMRPYVGINRVVVATAYDQSSQGFFLETSTEFMLTDQFAQIKPELKIDVELASHINAGSMGHGRLKIHNNGNCILSNVRYIQDKSNETKIEVSEPFYREIIVPGQVLSIPFAISPFEWFENGPRSVSVSASADSFSGTANDIGTKTFTVKPLGWVVPVTWIITIMAFGVFLWSLWSGAKLGSWMLQHVSKKKKSTDSGGKIIA